MNTCSAISKYHVVDKITGTPIGQHPLVTTAKKAFWQQRPPIPQYHGTYNVTIVLRFIQSLDENETLTIRQLFEKRAFLVAFSTLSKYCLVLTLDQIVLPKTFSISPFSLTVLLRVSSISVLGIVVHNGLDGAAVELIDLEKVLFTK